MTTMNLNAELFRELSYIADNESSMKKLLAFVKKLVAQQSKTAAALTSYVVSEETVPYHRLTREEQIAEVNEMCEEIKQIRAGKLKGRPAEELLNEL